MSENNLPALMDQLPDDQGELASGLTGGFPVLSIRSSRFRLKYQGTEQTLLDAEGNPVPSLELFLLKASPNLAKVYYESGYQDGSDDAPDCFSNDGVVPDPAVQKPVNKDCKSCPMNVFGSRITPSGSKVKACSDTRRLAVVPASDPKNEAFGGPILMRVPASSLGNLADYGRKLQQRGFKYAAVVTQVKFDIDAAFPKLTFTPKRVATEDEIKLIVEQINNPVVEQICHTLSIEEAAGQQAAQAAAAQQAQQPATQQPEQPQPAAIEQQPANTLESMGAQQEQPQAVPQPAAPAAAPPDPFAALSGAAEQPAPPAQPQPQPQPQQPAQGAPTPDPFSALGSGQQGQPQAAQPEAPAAAPAQQADGAQEDPAGGELEKDIQDLLSQLDAN